MYVAHYFGEFKPSIPYLRQNPQHLPSFRHKLCLLTAAMYSSIRVTTKSSLSMSIEITRVLRGPENETLPTATAGVIACSREKR